MKKIVFVLGILGLTLGVASCNINNSDISNIYAYYEDELISIDSSLKEDIEKAYKEKYSKDILWSNPKEDVTTFNSIDDLSNFVKSCYGYRVYAKYGDSYVLCQYKNISDTCEYIALEYNNNMIIYNSDNNTFGCSYNSTLIYVNNTITEVEDDYNHHDIASFLDISYEEALKIRTANEMYSNKHFSKFTKDNETIDDAYYRIINELTDNGEVKENTTTTITTTK